MPHHPTDLLEAYALHLLSPAGEQEVTDHLADCAQCRAEVAAQADALPLLAYAAPPHLPPPDLEDRLLARIDQIRRDEQGVIHVAAPPPPAMPITVLPRTGMRPPSVPPRRAPVWLGAMGALAAVIIFALVGARLLTNGGTSIPYRDRLVSQARTALHAPHAQVAFLTATSEGPRGAVAVLATDPTTDRAVLVVGHMPSLPSDQTYEVWLVHDANVLDNSTPQGVLPLGADGSGELSISAAGVARIQNAGISVEQADKPITKPDSPMLMLLHG